MTVNTDLGLSYELDLDINLAGSGVTPANWQQARFTSAIAPTHAPVMIDAATYDDEGAENQARIGETANCAFTIQSRRNPDGTFLPEVQALLNAAKPGVRGNASTVEVRYYDSEGADYAFQGIFTVQVDRGATGNAEAGIWSITLTSRGKVQPIANPTTGTVPTGKPKIVQAAPAGAAAGALVTIKGAGFTGATGVTGVKFGTVNATSYAVVADNTIVATVPTGAAGPANITVTNPTGASEPFGYTRGA